MTTMAARAMSVVPVWVLDDHVRTSHSHSHSHAHAHAVLGGYRHTVSSVPPVGRWVRGVSVRVHDLLSWLNVRDRHGLRVPVLNGRHVRSIPVAVTTRRDGDWVLHLRGHESRTTESGDQRPIPGD